MAYAALISLKQTIERLLNSSPISVPPPCPETLKSAYEVVKSLKYFVQDSFSNVGNSNSESANALERQIREAACRLEDALESHASDQLLSQFETLDVDLMGKSTVKDEIDFFTESVKKIGKEYSREDLEQVSKSEEDDASRIDDFDGMESKMVGLEDEISEMKDLLIHQWPSERKVIALAGMPGIGKTALAKQVYEDPSISGIFECRLWVRIGVEYQLKEIMLDILAKLDLGVDKIHAEESEKVAEDVSRSLQGKRYLIVLDDIWSTEAWNELEKFFPDDRLGSRILLTTRLQEIAVHARGHIVLKRFLDNEKSWCLLSQKVFGGEHSCPTDLEEAGKEIAEKCEGLPLAIIVVGKHLSEADKKPEYWKKVAKEEVSAIIGADEVMSKKLMLSYKHLPQYLKPCFLYMGVFPHGYEIPATKLINLCKPRFISGIKTCKVHSVFLYLCIKEAEKDKFFRVINNYANGVKEVLDCPSISKHNISWSSSIVSTHGDLESARTEAARSHEKRPTNPTSKDALLPNLFTLSGISTRSCTKEVLKRIPNLKNLRIQIEEAPGAAESLRSFDFDRGIKSLSFTIINPKPRPQVPAPIKSFPSGLTKLSLSGLGCPWKDIREIGKLWHLEVLKLKNYAFQGPEWTTDSFQFNSLKVFVLEDTDLGHWRPGQGSFIGVRHLIIRHCYKLEEIPLEIGIYPGLEKVELVDVKPSVVASAEKILQVRIQNNMRKIQVRVEFSWENQKLKS
ncbi:UNVERIFIED_CONTAM: putative disease resistance RPP13-like protein 3 [Sesamum radiatum]|uniref:Disease resistance RPP13-like protein 3 n=1 Tax=Sesamum radiatum TaxID=300843 RepID=A0AAW2S0A7_SESRA